MSEILDALKKLERDKAIRSNSAPNIAVEILRPDLPGRGRRPFLYLAAVFISAIAAAGITYALIGHRAAPPGPYPPGAVATSASPAPTAPAAAGGNPGAVSQARPVAAKRPAPVVAEAARPQSKSRPTPAAPAGSPAPAASSIVTAPAAPAAPAARTAVSSRPQPPFSEPPSHNEPPAALSVQTPPAKPVPIAPPVPASSPSSVTRDSREEATRAMSTAAVKEKPLSSIRIEEAPPPPPPPLPSSAVPSSLKITVIVWDEEPSKRWAMVNGMKVSEGSTVEGAKVEEISLSNIRFIHNGRSFEVSAR